MRHHLAAPLRLRGEIGPGSRVRWFADLDIHDERRYALIVGRVTAVIERRLGSGVVANRTAPDGTLLPLGPARRAWGGALTRAAATSPRAAAAVGDVLRCYTSIGPAAVDHALALAGVRSVERRPIVLFLEELARAGLRGLPIGPEPSAVLANCVLSVADEAVMRSGASVLRWVDDVVLLAAGPAAAARALDAWAGALRGLGLSPNDAKMRRIPAIGQAEGFTFWASQARTGPVP